ncbi:PBSX family phage terminase large subunit, partial [Bacillus cereus]
MICDGSIRAGKTVSMALSYVMWAMESFEGENFGMCGKTIGSHRRNVITPLKKMLKSRGYKVKDHRSENMLSITKDGVTNFFYIFGGKDESSQDLIQGSDALHYSNMVAN